MKAIWNQCENVKICMVLCQGYGGNMAEMAEISVRFGQDMHKIWLWHGQNMA